jgi:hypothetical protein
MHAPNLGEARWCLPTYLALAIVATYPLILHPFSSIPGSGDAYQFYWNLWWVKQALVDLRANPYVTYALFAPYGGHLYFHTLNLLQDLIALPVTVVLGLPAAYNATVWLSFGLSGYGAYRLGLYVLEREIDGDAVASNRRAAHLAAFVAGAGFAFSSYRFVHLLGHLDLVSTQWLPLFVPLSVEDLPRIRMAESRLLRSASRGDTADFDVLRGVSAAVPCALCHGRDRAAPARRPARSDRTHRGRDSRLRSCRVAAARHRPVARARRRAVIESGVRRRPFFG